MDLLKEVGIVLLLVGCILLIAPINGRLSYWGLPTHDVANLTLCLSLPLAVLALAGYDMWKLYESKKYARLQYFVFSLIIAFILSLILLFMILPYFEPDVVM